MSFARQIQETYIGHTHSSAECRDNRTLDGDQRKLIVEGVLFVSIYSSDEWYHLRRLRHNMLNFVVLTNGNGRRVVLTQSSFRSSRQRGRPCFAVDACRLRSLSSSCTHLTQSNVLDHIDIGSVARARVPIQAEMGRTA